MKNTEIQYHLDNKMVGFISYTKIPLMTYYALHSFFIYPEYRNKGYGKKLLLYACDYLKTTDGAKKIYIQPGPFEIEHGNMKTIPNEVRSQKIQELIKLYQYAGFEFVSTFTSTCVRFYIDY